MTEAQSILRLTGVRIERAGTVIVDGVDWTVNAGEHWVVVGANGSGKTSLLSAIMGYLPATQGDIEVLGERYGESDWREMRRRIGVVSTALAPMLESGELALKTVLSGKQALLGYYGPSEESDIERARKILAQVESEHLADRAWHLLSQGEKQKVLIGRALMARAALLVLDEPCAGLDPVARERFLAFLERWASRSEAPSLVLVTHHLEEVMPAFTHVLVLRKGKVVAAGPKDEVLGSETLSKAFDVPVRVWSKGGRYALVVGGGAKKSDPPVT
ncbi:MAG TPA: ATP-binding cassette domain-containing protein [Polyangiaceae bacterium]|jgi:iron complex transport system ATP-binding protein